MNRYFSFTLLLLVFIVVGDRGAARAADDDAPSINRLREDLIVKQKYDRNARPVKHHSSTTIIKVVIVVTQFTDLNTQTHLLTTDALLILQWKDEHLVWEPSNYGGIESINFGSDEIWKPDFVNWNGAEGGKLSDNLAKHQLIVNYTGEVDWYPLATFKTPCYMDLSEYPFDEQGCNLYFGTWVHTMHEVNLTINDDNRLYGPSYPNPEWGVVSKKMSRYELDYDDHYYSALQVSVRLKRRSTLYRYCILLPYLVATFMAITMFSVPIESNLRLIFAGLSMFILTFLLLFIGVQLGFHTFRVPYSVKCVSINLFLVGLALAVTHANKQLFVGTSLPCPALISGLLRNPLLARICCFCSRNATGSKAFGSESLVADEDQSQLTSVKPSETSSDWYLLASVIDRLLFVSYLIMVLIYHS